MPFSGEKLHALLATGRVANIPTVCSNVLAGFWLSSSLIPAYHIESFGNDMRITLVIGVMFIASMIYVAGCMLGDARDVDFDRQNRPNRPIPRGVLSAKSIEVSSYALFTLAIIGLFAANIRWTKTIQIHEITLGFLLVLGVILYAFNHKKNKPAALLMMASCRLLLIMFAIGAAHKTFFADPSSTIGSTWLDSWMLIQAFSVAVYTLLLSWVASTESKPGAFKSRNILASLLLAVPATSILFRFCFPAVNPAHYLWQAAALVMLYLWLSYTLAALKTSKPAFVSRALAGFCLLDACFLATIAPAIAMICLAFFALALLLQRITPAT